MLIVLRKGLPSVEAPQVAIACAGAIDVDGGLDSDPPLHLAGLPRLRQPVFWGCLPGSRRMRLR
eukprot:7171888-Pyramimonas_sp.AAC.1